MLGRLKQRWREFRSGRPGQRFQDRFERNRQAKSAHSAFTRFLKPVAAVVVLVAGVGFCLIPGPGLPLLLVGAALLADVSRRVASALDWLEVRVRDGVTKARQWWMAASTAVKCAVIVLAVVLVSGAAYGGFRILMD